MLTISAEARKRGEPFEGQWRGQKSGWCFKFTDGKSLAAMQQPFPALEFFIFTRKVKQSSFPPRYRVGLKSRVIELWASGVELSRATVDRCRVRCKDDGRWTSGFPAFDSVRTRHQLDEICNQTKETKSQ